MPLPFAVLHPDTRDEARHLRNHRDYLFAQLTLRLLHIADRDVDDDCVHTWLLGIAVGAILAHDHVGRKAGRCVERCSRRYPATYVGLRPPALPAHEEARRAAPPRGRCSRSRPSAPNARLAAAFESAIAPGTPLPSREGKRHGDAERDDVR